MASFKRKSIASLKKSLRNPFNFGGITNALMGKSKKGVNGFRYGFGIHMGIARSEIDELLEIRVGDKTAWTGSQTDSGAIAINAPELFGGDKQEGGVVGSFYLSMGKVDQGQIPGLAAMIGRAIPAFRRSVTAFFDGIVATNSPYPKAWKFRVRRTTKGWMGGAPWYPEKCKILLSVTDEDGTHDIHAMNPAHILYECITNKVWGRGLPPSVVDLASFTQAADTLFDENLGLCFRWTRRDNVQTFVQSVLNHIGAVLYPDRATALLTLKLIRFDYVIDQLPIFDTENGLLSVDEAAVSALGPTVNEVRVVYVDPITGMSRTTQAQNLAALQANAGIFNSTQIQYQGIPTPDLALRLAQRDLRANSSALRRFKLTMDRRAWKISPGSVFRLRNPQRGIGDIVLRVGQIEDGTLIDGKIKITAVQDIFAFPQSSFIGVEPPKWVKPNTVPELKRHRVIEMPYGILNHFMNPADFDYISQDGGYIGTLVEKPTPMSGAYDYRVRDGYHTPDDIPPP